MKTLVYQIKKAFGIAAIESQSCVGVFCKDWASIKEDVMIEVQKHEASFIPTSRTIKFSNGATIRFGAANTIEEMRNHLHGSQFSHIFVESGYDLDIRNYIQSRLRSTNKFDIEPMGFYTDYEVLRWEDY
jgi:hypothetical protein